ncbi:MAG TPA: carboxypeptidase-like regulatory domain-containing protein [Chitinophagaceae bacterium]|nr:carboxypeptidase-like regulatory domain-containing protein [Chitinophagaceae bacterium]
MKRHPLYLVLLLTILAVAGNCRKAEHSLESAEVSFAVSGRVTDENNQPVSQAQVRAGSATAVTDINGHFTIENVRAPKDAAYVEVEKSGYFPGSRTFIATSRATNYVSISLLPKKITGSFTAQDGGTVPADGGSITFQKNSITDLNGAPYSGPVNVATAYIDPTAANFTDIMPGALRGINSNNQERGLQSFGMMAVELTGAGGITLQLAAGKPATMNFEIPASLVSKAPATIPLWYFDEEKGLWKEEGSAVKTGDRYIGTVSHFSFWNCDAPFELVQFEAVIKGQNGSPVANAAVHISQPDGMTGSGRTDSEGRVKGLIPANQALILQVEDHCGAALHTQNIGPYTSNINIGAIMVNASTITVTITGTAVNCNNQPVANGFASLSLEGMNYRAQISNGSFTLTAPRCSANPADGELRIVDAGSGQQSAPQTLNLTSGNVNAGQVQACGVSTTEFVNYTIGSTQYSFTVPPDSIRVSVNPQHTSIDASYKNSSPEYLVLSFASTTTGTFPTSYLSVHVNSRYYHGSDVSVTVTEYGSNPNQYIAGSFTGVLSDSSSSGTTTINGNFRVKRP